MTNGIKLSFNKKTSELQRAVSCLYHNGGCHTDPTDYTDTKTEKTPNDGIITLIRVFHALSYNSACMQAYRQYSN